MAGNIKNVIVVGAGGVVGKAILAALLNSTHKYSISVLSREGSSYTPPDGIPVLKTDYTHGSLVKALKGQDAVVSAIAGAALLEQIKIVDAAIEAGVKRFIPSEYGTDTDNKHSHTRVPLFVLKYQVAEHLKKNQDKIEWTVFATGPFIDQTLESGFLGFDLANNTATAWDDKYKDVKFSMTRMAVAAQVVVDSLSPSLAPRTANQSFYIRDVTVSLSNLLAALEKATSSTWNVNHIDCDAVVEESMTKLNNGDFSGIRFIIFGNVLDIKSGNNFDQRGIVSNELFGLRDVDLQSIVDEVVARAKGAKATK